MTTRKNIRVMTAVSPELNNKLTQLCTAYGMTKSALMAYYIGKMVDTETRVQGLTSNESMIELIKSLANVQESGQHLNPNLEIYEEELKD